MSKRDRALARGMALAAMVVLSWAPEARAQSYVSPLVGYDFGGDSICERLAGCEEKRLNVGVALGRLGPILGYETDFSYVKDFFGTGPGVTSSLLTIMGNVLLVPAVGPVRPYAVAGLGLMRSVVDISTAAGDNTNTDFGWDVGGGVFVFFGRHVGVRGDIRYFHSFEDLTIAGIPLADAKLDFGRASAALVLAF